MFIYIFSNCKSKYLPEKRKGNVLAHQQPNPNIPMFSWNLIEHVFLVFLASCCSIQFMEGNLKKKKKRQINLNPKIKYWSKWKIALALFVKKQDFLPDKGQVNAGYQHRLFSWTIHWNNYIFRGLHLSMKSVIISELNVNSLEQRTGTCNLQEGDTWTTKRNQYVIVIFPVCSF